MSFQKLLAAIQMLKLVEKRTEAADYLEVVVERDHLKPLSEALAAYFGVPLKPEGLAPSGKANQLAQAYGGIRADQTMYYRQSPEHDEFAFLWPWGNGVRVTLKIIQSPPSPKSCCFMSFLGRLLGNKKEAGGC